VAKKPPNFGRRQPQDIIRQQPCITNAANCNLPMGAFDVFVTPVMVDLVVLETNQEARHYIKEWNNVNPEQHKVWKAVNATKMKAFIGFCLLAGASA